MSEQFNYFEDIRDYAMEVLQSAKELIVGGLTVIALAVGNTGASACNSFQYEIPTENYEYVGPVVNTLDWDEDSQLVMKTVTLECDPKNLIKNNSENPIYEALVASLERNGGAEMTSDCRHMAMECLKNLSVLPIQKSQAQFNPMSKALFMTMLLPEKLLISATRYLDGVDEELYFSVKGDGTLLASGSLSHEMFIETTLEALEKIGRKA